MPRSETQFIAKVPGDVGGVDQFRVEGEGGEEGFKFQGGLFVSLFRDGFSEEELGFRLWFVCVFLKVLLCFCFGCFVFVFVLVCVFVFLIFSGRGVVVEEVFGGGGGWLVGCCCSVVSLFFLADVLF